MKVLIADRISPSGIQKLQDAGCEVNFEPDLAGADLACAVARTSCHILVVRGTKVSAEAIRAHKELGLIVRVGAGYDSIDVASASTESVFVANCPGKNAAAVAELTLGLILALDRRIPHNVVDLRGGRWAKKEYSAARGLKGRTLGVIGVGQIGELVVRRAQAFEMNVVGWSRRLTSQKAAALDMVRLELPEVVAATCDVLTVHLSLTPDTHGFIDQHIFEELKAGAYFINTSRAEIVDYEALSMAIVDKGIRAGLDVFRTEPSGDGAFTDPIVHLDGVVYGTHHIGASTEQAQDASADEMVGIVKEYIATGHVLNCVNISRGITPRGVLVVRHRNKPGMLAKVLAVLAEHDINVREMENVICEGELSACAQIRLDAKPQVDVLEELKRVDRENILGVSMTHAGY